MDGIHSLFPADYDMINQRLIMEYNSPKDCMTLVAPSGFGKTIFLKFLAYNPKFLGRHRRLRKTKICYCDCAQVEMYSPAAMSGSLIPEAPPVGILAQLILNSIKEQLDHSKAVTVDTNPSSINIADLTKQITELLERNKEWQFLICMDNVESLLKQPRFRGCLDYVRQLYDLARLRVRYLFALQNVDAALDISEAKWGTASTMLSHRVVYMRLPLIAQRLHPEYKGLLAQILHHFRINTANYRAKVDQLQVLTGGYQPYVRWLINEPTVPRQVNLTPELNSSSQRLLGSLSAAQVKILRQVAHSQPVQRSFEFELLVKMGILSEVENGVRLFSPIMHKYLVTYPVAA